MRHNHICHNHHSNDLCGDGPGHLHYLTHDHWLGRSAAEDPSEEEHQRDLAEKEYYANLPDDQRCWDCCFRLGRSSSLSEQAAGEELNAVQRKNCESHAGAEGSAKANRKRHLRAVGLARCRLT